VTRLAALLAAASVLVGLAVGVFIVVRGSGDDPFASCRRTQVAGGRAEIGGPFSLIDGTGARVTEAEVIDRPTLVYFGYSFCPDVCPTDLARNAVARDILAERGLDVRLAFITIDPERDTADQMGPYAAALHPDMIGLTGTPEEIEAAAAAYRVFFRKAGEDPEFYLMDHSTYTYLMAPDVGFLEFFGSDVAPDAMADSAACFVGKL
jgi:protein SCO1/2